MNTQMFILMVMGIAASICISIVVASLYYESKKKKLVLTEKQRKEDWLLSDIHESLFNAFFSKEAESYFGINAKDYERKCRILHRENDMKRVVGKRIEGVLLFMALMLISFYVSGELEVMMLFMGIAFCSLFALYYYPYKNIENEAESVRYQIIDSMPRFFSLMEKALDFPVDQAIAMTAQKFTSPLSVDLLDCFNKVSLGAGGWQSMLTDLAGVYQYDPFNDFVLDMINSYEQGTNIRLTVERRVREMEESRIFDVESHDSKIKTLMFLPIIIFKCFPLMALIGIPMVADFMF